MTKTAALVESLNTAFSSQIQTLIVAHDEVTLECNVADLKPLLTQLRDNVPFLFDELIDVCAVDYLHYGQYDWETDPATELGFSRGVEAREERATIWDKPRFAVVYHLLSTHNNHRLRVKV